MTVAAQPIQLTEDLPFQILRRTWQPVANAASLLPGQIMGYTLLDTPLLVARFVAGHLLASDPACPHKGANLTTGCIRDDELVCPYHGWRFNAAGACQSIPSLIDANADKLALSHLRTYAVQERFGFIWVKLDAIPLADGRPHELPPVPEFENPTWTYVMGPPTPFTAGWRREVENFVDMTHFAFTHSDTLGKAADYRVPPMDIQIMPDGGFQMVAPFPALNTPHEPPGKLQSAHRRQQRCYLPNFTTIRQSFADGDERVLVHIPSPNTRESCTVFWSLAISPGFKGPAPAAQMDFAIKVLDEDRRMVGAQFPAEVPINPSRGGWGVLVMPGDTLANTFQKQLRRWLLAEAQASAGDRRSEFAVRNASP